MVKNAWWRLVSWVYAIQIVLKWQAMRDRLYKASGEYPQWEIEMFEDFALFWPEGSRFPAPINPAVKLAHKIRMEEFEKSETETVIDPETGAKITTIKE